MVSQVMPMMYIEHWFGNFRRGGVYALATRPGLGKTHFALTLCAYRAKVGQKVLFVSDVLDAKEFQRRIDRIEPDYDHRQVIFMEKYSLSKEKLAQWVTDSGADLLILDPYGIYCWDVDPGELKELAQEHNVCIFLTAQLTPFEKRPSLAHLRFPEQRLLDKFVAYSDGILLGFSKGDSICLRPGKNALWSMTEDLEVDKKFHPEDYEGRELALEEETEEEREEFERFWEEVREKLDEATFNSLIEGVEHPGCLQTMTSWEDLFSDEDDDAEEVCEEEEY